MKTTFQEIGHDFRQTIVLTQLEANALAEGTPLHCKVLPQPYAASHVYHHEPDDWWVFGDNTGRLRMRPYVEVRPHKSPAYKLGPCLEIEERRGRWEWVMTMPQTAMTEG